MKRFTCLAIVAVNYASAARKCMGHYGPGGDDKEIQETSLEWYCDSCNCKDLSDRTDKATPSIQYCTAFDPYKLANRGDRGTCLDYCTKQVDRFQNKWSCMTDKWDNQCKKCGCTGCQVDPAIVNASASCSSRMKKMDDEWRTTCKNVEYTATGCADFKRECGMWPQQCYGYPKCTSFKTDTCCTGPTTKPIWHESMDPKALPNGLKDKDYDRYEDGYSWRVQTNSTTNSTSISGDWDRRETDYMYCFYKDLSDNAKEIGNTGDYEHVDDIVKAEQCGKNYCFYHENWMRNECMKQFNTTQAVYYQCKRDVVTFEQECFKQVDETVSHVKNFNITDSSTWENKNLMQVDTNSTNGANSTASTSDAAKLFTTGAASMILTSAVLF